MSQTPGFNPKPCRLLLCDLRYSCGLPMPQFPGFTGLGGGLDESARTALAQPGHRVSARRGHSHQHSVSRGVPCQQDGSCGLRVQGLTQGYKAKSERANI